MTREVCLLMWDVDGYAVNVAHRDEETGKVFRTVQFEDEAAAFAAYSEANWVARDSTDPRTLVAVGYLDEDEVEEDEVEEDAPQPEGGDAPQLWDVKLTATVMARTSEEAVQIVSDFVGVMDLDVDVIQSLRVDGGGIQDPGNYQAAMDK